MHRHPSYPAIILAALLLLALVFTTVSPASAHAASDQSRGTITAIVEVNSPNDANDGACDATHCSLREAIIAANADGPSTINFSASVTGTITLGSALPWITVDIVINGPGSALLTVDGGNAFQVMTVAAPSAVITGLTLAHGFTTGNGGGMYIDVDSGTLDDVVFLENQANLPGGALVNYGDLRIQNSAFTSNISRGVDSLAGGGAIINLGALQVITTTFTTNQASYGSNGAGWGGAISSYAMGSLAITNSSFTGNQAASGGAIANNGLLTMNGVAFISNVANQNNFGDGGALHNTYASAVGVLNNVIFANNFASTRGGAIYNESSGDLTLINCQVLNNQGLNNGGGLYNGQNPSNDLPRLSLAGTTVSGNHTDQGGGGVYNCGILQTSGSDFTTNSAYYGGGLFNFCPGAQAAVSQSTFTGNSAQNGGGLYNWASLTLTETEVATNTAASGAGLYHLGAESLSISSSPIHNNTATDGGGGMYLVSTALVTLSGLELTNNQAASGGAIVNAGQLALQASMVEQNSASAVGGGVYNTAYASLSLTGVALLANDAPSGGGLYADRSSTTVISNTLVLSNTADTGGGAYNSGGTVNATVTIFAGNDATTGGAIFNGIEMNYYPSTQGTLALNQSILAGNSAVDGAGVYNDASPVTVTGGNFQSNRASLNGGGIYNTSRTNGWPVYLGTLAIDGATLELNSAASAGGGIYNDGDLTLHASTLLDNGQGLYMTGGTLLATNNTISLHDAAGLVFASGRTINAVVGGAAADFNTFANNGPDGLLNVQVTSPNTNPPIEALWNDWGVDALQAIEDTISHRFDDPNVAQVNYYTVDIIASPLTQVADGVSTVAVTTTLSGWLNPLAGDLVNFDTTLGTITPAQAATLASGQALSSLTSTTTGTADITTYAAVDPVMGRTATTSVLFTGLTADLAVAKSDGQTSATPGALLTYVITATNAGPQAANGAVLADVLPATLSGASWTCSEAGGALCPAAAGSGGLNETIAVFPAGGTLIYTLQATLAPGATGTLANTVTLTPPAGIDDPNLANNSATDSDALEPWADLFIFKSSVQEWGIPGGPVTFTLMYANNGPSLATGVFITDTLPVSVTNASYASAGAVITNTGYTPAYVWQVADLLPGEGGVITITGVLAYGLPGWESLFNEAHISSSAYDPSWEDNLGMTAVMILNVPPEADVPPQAVAEQTLLSFNLNAVDPNGDPISYTLLTAPAGATLDDVGQFNWTPGEAEGPGVYTATVLLDDNIGQEVSLVDFTITVSEVNTPPALDPIGNQMVDELALLSFTATAADSDLPANALSFSLGAGAPAGAAIDPASGVFTWTPTEAQGPGLYSATVIASDNGTPAMSDTETITITVGEVNTPPVLDPIGDQEVDEQALLTFTATAADSDLPANALRFSLGAGAPAGAAIDLASGVFTWTPSEAQGPGVYPVTIITSDDGVPVLNDAETISITVHEVTLPTVDLALSMTASSQQAISCTQTTFTLTVANPGQTVASGVTLTATLPEGLSYAASTPACSQDGAAVVCALGDLPAAQSASVAMQVNVEAAGLLTTLATVGANQADPDLTNNQASFGLTGLTSLTFYSDDFEGGSSGFWSSELFSVTPSGRGFLGEFNNETVTLALEALPAHCSVNIAYDLFVINSWDGNQDTWSFEGLRYYTVESIIGPDHFSIAADGQTLLSTNFTNWDSLGFTQAYPGAYGSGDYPARTGAVENNTLGYIFGDFAMDSVYHMSFDFAHLDDLLQVAFAAWGLQPITDESWGIDNIVVTIGSGPGEAAPVMTRYFIPLVLR